MHNNDEYDRLAEWFEAGAMDDTAPEMKLAPIGWGISGSVVIGAVMYWLVRAVAWVIARGWL